MSIVRVHSIEDTQLCRHRELEEHDSSITYPWNDVLLNIHLLRSAAFVPSRFRAGPADQFVCPQLPASRGLYVRQPQGPLQVRDALLLGELLRRYSHGIGTRDRRVFLSLSEAALAMGYARPLGGEQRRRAHRSLQRLAASTFCWKEADTDDTVRVLDWHPLEEVWIDESRESGCAGTHVTISPVTAELVEDGYLHYLKADVCRRLVAHDELAARLWMALESERMSEKPFHYHVFRSPTGCEPQHSDQLFIAEVIGLYRWENRRRAVDRLRHAIEAIMAIDVSRYALCLTHGRDPGMYVLAVSRRARERRQLTVVDNHGSGRNAPRYGREQAPVASGTQGGSDGNAPRYGEERLADKIPATEALSAPLP